MTKNNFARKKRQLKLLADRLHEELRGDSIENSSLIEELKKKISGLINDLKRFISRFELSQVLGALAVFFGLAVGPSATAQTFAAPVINPFSIDSVYQYAFPTFADLDDDGDLDLMVADYYGEMNYFENTGSVSAPNFASPINMPFGLTDTSTYYLKPVFADIDGDGDYDLFAGELYYGQLYYYENVGSKTVPQFAARVTNPFGFTSYNYGIFPTFTDLDDDGDLDMMVGVEYGVMNYYENTGTKTAPQFAAATPNPFGLTSVYDIALPEFVDLDLDGDMDLLVGEYYADFQYFENTGSRTVPQFASPQTNPFNLTPTANSYVAVPVSADIDGDGDYDLFVGGAYYGTMEFFQNNDPTAGISEIAPFESAIFPSPASDYFEIQTEEEIVKLEILDLTGKLIRTVENPFGRIDVSNLVAGSYLLKLQNRDGLEVVQKLNKI